MQVTQAFIGDSTTSDSLAYFLSHQPEDTHFSDSHTLRHLNFIFQQVLVKDLCLQGGFQDNRRHFSMSFVSSSRTDNFLCISQRTGISYQSSTALVKDFKDFTGISMILAIVVSLASPAGRVKFSAFLSLASYYLNLLTTDSERY